MAKVFLVVLACCARWYIIAHTRFRASCRIYIISKVCKYSYICARRVICAWLMLTFLSGWYKAMRRRQWDSLNFLSRPQFCSSWFFLLSFNIQIMVPSRRAIEIFAQLININYYRHQCWFFSILNNVQDFLFVFDGHLADNALLKFGHHFRWIKKTKQNFKNLAHVKNEKGTMTWWKIEFRFN